MNHTVFISQSLKYDLEQIKKCLPTEHFSAINSQDKIILKPNWIAQAHQYKPDEWEYVITHPMVITAVIHKVLDRLSPGGSITIIDGPETASSFKKIISHYPVDKWMALAQKKGVDLKIIDLRDNEWLTDGETVLERKDLPGDPKGSTEVNLAGNKSEFHNHKKSKKGYYGADYNIKETNDSHNGQNNKYRVSRTVIECDVFINLPKLKTHKKAGITCCLKNLVGINTYRNFLPHHSMGTHKEGGDQFIKDTVKSKVESDLLAIIKQHLLQNKYFAKIFTPVKKLGKKIFGDTNEIVRSGNWYGNDTIWRMILDLNKILLYANPDGSMREDLWIKTKKYIGIVDAVLAGEGSGPKAPDPVEMGYLIAGTNPVAIDSVCARLMGFDPLKIPSIANAFYINKYPIVNFAYNDIEISINENSYSLHSFPEKFYVPFKPHFGWKGYIEI